jgi:hypothetical protein
VGRRCRCEDRRTIKGKIIAWLIIGALIYWASREPATAAAVARDLGEWMIHGAQGVAHRPKAQP